MQQGLKGKIVQGIGSEFFIFNLFGCMSRPFISTFQGPGGGLGAFIRATVSSH